MAWLFVDNGEDTWLSGAFAWTRWRLVEARKWLKDPLAHFVLVGAIIFALNYFLMPRTDPGADANRIVLTQDDVRQLAIQWLAQGRPMPTRDEMRALVEQRVSEEILSREAAALGLDKNDEIIKRRLAQKMDFLAEDIAALQDPSEAELRNWYAQNASRFALAPRVSFRHVYFSADRGPSARAAAAAALTSVAGLAATSPDLARIGDPFMFQDYYAERAPDQLLKEFGPDFAKAVLAMEPGAWRGPVQSGYGWHLVFVEAKEPSRTPAFEEVAPDVKTAWLDEKQRQFKRAAFEAMRARYTVTVPPIEDIDLNDLRAPQTPALATVTPQ